MFTMDSTVQSSNIILYTGILILYAIPNTSSIQKIFNPLSDQNLLIKFWKMYK